MYLEGAVRAGLSEARADRCRETGLAYALPAFLR